MQTSVENNSWLKCAEQGFNVRVTQEPAIRKQTAENRMGSQQVKDVTLKKQIKQDKGS